MRAAAIICAGIVLTAMTLPAVPQPETPQPGKAAPAASREAKEQNRSAVNAKDEISAKARKLHFSSIVIDTHDDTTQRLIYQDFDLGKLHSDGSIDIPRMKAGGLDAIFFSIWMSGKITGPLAVKKSLDQIEAVRGQASRASQ